jgi:hypothetical protein
LFGSLVGYALLDSADVYELAFDERVEPMELVNFIAHKLTRKTIEVEINFELPQQHTLVSELNGFELNLSQRECYYGGHMACILNLDNMINSKEEQEYGGVTKLGALKTRPDLGYRETCQVLGVSTISGDHGFSAQRLPFNISLADHF